uniref:Uncharacterized protein n=1 Tax=Anguilla anguilla TaxID=7936 RepID=A0A0E9WGZ5_ANGAN
MDITIQEYVLPTTVTLIDNIFLRVQCDITLDTLTHETPASRAVIITVAPAKHTPTNTSLS